MIIKHSEITDAELRKAIRQKQVCFGGNATLKIYGMLRCGSGKRLYKENRVFFSSQQEAIENNYRPCGHCMKTAYKQWKSLQQK